MVDIIVQRTYPVAGEVLWSRISDFYDMSWLPAVAQSRKMEEVTSRVAVLPDGAGEVVEQLTEQGPRMHRYRVTSPGPMPVSGFIASIKVEDVDATSSRVLWQAHFDPVGASAADAEALVTGVFTGALARLAES